MATGFFEKKEYPPKVIAMNEAVISLLAEGREITSLRVSEITERAGIGKGTAYEYFASKAEIIMSAMEYDLDKQIARLAEMEEKATGFRDMLETLMAWVAENFRNHSVFTYAFRRDAGVREMSKDLEPDACPFEAGREGIRRMTEEVLEIGEREGIIKKMNHYFGTVAIFSQLMLFSFYLGNPHDEKVTVEEANEFAVNSIIKMLN